MTDNPRVVAIIQARLGSSRLPGKVLLPIGAATMLERVVQRVRRARSVAEVVVATTVAAKDDALAAFCREHDIAVHRGSEDDVLDRYYRAATEARADVVVRVTSDCPLIDPAVIDRVVDRYRRGGVDYVANNFRYTYPQGLDTEAFSLAVLARAWREATQPAEREHVTPYLRSRARFGLAEVENDQDLSQRNLRWTVDEPADLEFMRAVYARLDERGEARFGLPDVLALLQREPALASLNAGIVRHEGYYLSLTKEMPIPAMVGVGATAPLERGQGGRVWDSDGTVYWDLGMDGGNVILGHHAAAVTEAATEALRAGGVTSAGHPLATIVADTLARLIPGVETATLVESSAASEELAAAIARRYSRRTNIVHCDEADSEAVARLFAAPGADIAALVLEPSAIGAGCEPDGAFFAVARGLCERHGALLIADERRTAFRYAQGGAQAHFGFQANLTLLGPSLANGHPIAAVLGRASLLRERVLDARPPSALALAAARATLQELRAKPVAGHLWEQGGRLRDGFNVLAAHYGLAKTARSVGPGPLCRIVFGDSALGERFARACRARGVLLGDTQAVSFSHGQDDTDQILRVYRSVLELTASGGLP